MGPLTVTRPQTKEMKNTVRREEARADQSTVNGTLHLQKWAVHRRDDPEAIAIIITAT